MPSGMAELLRRKYDIMQQGADTQQMGMVADANLANVRAGLLPAEAKASREKMEAETAGTLESNKWIDDLAKSGISLQGTQGRLNVATIGKVNAEASGEREMSKILPTIFGLRRAPDEDDKYRSLISNAVRIGMGPFGN